MFGGKDYHHQRQRERQILQTFADAWILSSFPSMASQRIIVADSGVLLLLRLKYKTKQSSLRCVHLPTVL